MTLRLSLTANWWSLVRNVKVLFDSFITSTTIVTNQANA